MRSAQSVASRVRGAIYGHLLGDAFGVPYEFSSPDRLPSKLEWTGFGTHQQPRGTWSDDGALMLCQIESLLNCGQFSDWASAKLFAKWLEEGHHAAGGLVFDVGVTCPSPKLDPSRRQALVSMVQPSNPRNRHNLSPIRPVHSSGYRCILGKTEMRPAPLVVLEVAL